MSKMPSLRSLVLKYSFHVALLLSLQILFPSGGLLACPLIDGLVDYNCDESLKIAITGDSIVFGVGDSERFGDNGGYVARLQSSLPMSEVANLGIPGITSWRLLRSFKRNLSKVPPGETIRKMSSADVVVIAVGINDYFERREPGRTVRNIQRLIAFLKDFYRNRNQTVPAFRVSLLTPTRRSYQQPFVSEVNRLLLRFRSERLPIGPDFSKLNTRLLRSDGLHPSNRGYDALAARLLSNLRGPLMKQLLGDRPDSDNDGVYDLFEIQRFGTSVSLPDTDGDGKIDGYELFLFHTDPLDPFS